MRRHSVPSGVSRLRAAIAAAGIEPIGAALVPSCADQSPDDGVPTSEFVPIVAESRIGSGAAALSIHLMPHWTARSKLLSVVPAAIIVWADLLDPADHSSQYHPAARNRQGPPDQ